MTDDLTFFGTGRGYMFSWLEQTFSETEDPMPYPSIEASCGSATTEDGSRIIVVAGGYYDSTSQSRVQVFDGRTWSLGPELPMPLAQGRVVSTRNSFLIVGGRSGSSGGVDTILEVNPRNMTWETRSETTQHDYYMQYVVPVESKLFCT